MKSAKIPKSAGVPKTANVPKNVIAAKNVVVPKTVDTPKNVGKVVEPTKIAPTTVLPAMTNLGPTADQQALSQTKSPIGLVKTARYELVRPSRYHGDWADVWQAEEESGSVRIAKRQWIEKENAKRRKTFLKAVTGFSAGVVIILAVVAVGAYFMVNERLKKDSALLDGRLKTKTSACRAHVSLNKAQCVYEIPDEYEYSCAGHHVCGLLQWAFEYDPTRKIGVIKRGDGHAPAVTAKETNYADCGFLKWCQGGDCSPSELGEEQWWPAADSPFQEPKWVNVARGQRVPCVVPKGARADQEWKKILDSYHDQCNTDGCLKWNGSVKHGVQLEVRHCDLEQDLKSGWRRKPCEGEPIRYKKCSTCENFNETNEGSLRNCANGSRATFLDANNDCSFQCGGEHKVVPDGALCAGKVGKAKKAGICFGGYCQIEQGDEEDDEEDETMRERP